MKRKGVCVMVGVILVCLLTGMLGVYSASGRTEIGLTYRLNDCGGVKIETQSGFGGELLLEYYRSTYESSGGYGTSTSWTLQPSILYRFKRSSDTSIYVGLGYVYSPGFSLLVGLEHFFSEKFSVDLRVTAGFGTWTTTWDSWEEHGEYTNIYVDMGVSIYR